MAKPTPNLPVSYQEQLAQESANIANQIQQPGGDRIRYSKANQLVLPDGSEVDEIEGVILSFVSMNLFYDRDYDKNNPIPPACFAIHQQPSLLTPSPNSPVIQVKNAGCNACPNNQFGSRGKGKACKNTRQYAFIPYEALASGESDIWIGSVPVMSVRAFDSYVQLLATRHKTVPIGVKTLLSMDKEADYASPRFKVVSPLDESDLKAAMELRQTALTRLMTEPDVSGYQPPPKAGRVAARR